MAEVKRAKYLAMKKNGEMSRTEFTAAMAKLSGGFYTRRRLRGGFNATNQTRVATHVASRAAAVQKQIQHCVSQLRRFCNCFQKGDMGRLLQFGYNLGRLQELCGETEKHTIWWKPVEAAIAAGRWQELSDYIDTMRAAIGIEYDSATVAGSC